MRAERCKASRARQLKRAPTEMISRRANCKEGDWIALPLVRRGGWALGLIARYRAPSFLGYFFGPRHENPPTMDDTQGLTAADAILIGHTGNLGLRKGEWHVIGHHPFWSRANWPMPKSWMLQDGQHYLMTYDDDDPGRMIDRHPVAVGEIAGAIPSIVNGHVALAIKLDVAIAGNEDRTAA